MFSLLFFLCGAEFGRGNDAVPSLIIENTTMAVYLDKQFFNDISQYEYYKSQLPQMIQKTVQVYMKITSINVHILKDLNINLRRDYMMLLTIMDCQNTWLTFQKAKFEEVIYIAVTDSSCPRIPRDEGFSIPMLINELEISQIILDLRSTHTLHWTRINIIYDDTFGIENIHDILQSLTKTLEKEETMITTTLFAIKYEKNITSVEQQIVEIFNNFSVDELGHCFMVIVSADIVSKILQKARLMKLTIPENQWLFIISNGDLKNNSSLSDFGLSSAEGENLAFVYNVSFLNGNCEVNLICRVKEFVKLLAISIDNFALNEIGLYEHVTDEEFNIFKISKRERKYDLMRFINQDIYKKTTLISNCGGCLVWKVTSIISWGSSLAPENDTEIYLDVGYWNLDIGINMWDDLFPHMNYGFRGKMLPIATYHNPPWQIFTVSNNGEKIFTGLIFDIMEHLSKTMNFTMNVSLSVTDEIKVSMKKNHQDNISQLVKFDEAAMSTAQIIPEDIMQLIINNKIFLGACASSTLKNTRQGINFTLPISIQSYSLLAPNPVILSRAMLFIAPYTSETWAVLFASILLLAPFLYFIQKSSFYFLEDFEEKVGFHTHWQCIWYIYGALLQQGGMNLPQSSSVRIIIGMWWLVVMVLVAMYSGTLVAFLTFPRIDEAISSFDDLLARKDEFSWGFPNGSIVEDYIKTLDNPKYEKFLEKAERHNTTDITKIIARMKGKKHVILDWTSSLRFIMRTDLLLTGQCYFTLSSTNVANEPIALLVSEDNPYIHIINKQLQRMHENGLIKKWTTNRMPVKDQCWEGKLINPEATKHKVNMSDMQGIFFVLAIGFTFAVIFICCEFYCHRRKVAREMNLVRPFIN